VSELYYGKICDVWHCCYQRVALVILNLCTLECHSWCLS